MAQCVTCGSELHPERAEKYNYCTKRQCREQNAKPLTIAVVGVNKSADQFLVLNEQTKADLAAGKYQDRRKSSAVTDGPAPERARIPSAGTRPSAARRTSTRQRPRRSWSKAQEDLALIYNARGMRPDEIAERLGVSRSTVTQMILSGRNQAKR